MYNRLGLQYILGMERTRVEWKNHDQTLVGHCYKPAAEPPWPTLVMCHGFAGVKELLLPPVAQRFAEAGYCVLTFDYRGFGESEGERGRLVPSLQIDDICSALEFVATQPFVAANRIGLWGTSLGGANAIIAATQTDKVKALAVQLTFANGERVVTGSMSAPDKEKFLQTMQRMADKRDRTGKEMMVPLKKVLTDAQSVVFYEQHVEEFDALKIKVPFLTVLETMALKPEEVLAKLKVPLHITGASNDSVNPAEESQLLYEQASEPKALLMLDGAEHYKAYEGQLLTQVTNAQLDWFGKYL